MTIWAIVPVKPLLLGKSRIAGVISDEDRIKLNIRLLEHTLKTLKLLPEIGQVLVVSRDLMFYRFPESLEQKLYWKMVHLN